MRAVQVLRSQWQQSAERLERRLAGLTDDEYFWEPAPGAWNVYLDPERGGWSYPYEFAPDPAPVTEWIERATGADLDEQRPSHLGGTRSAGAVLQILVDEQIHHAAEIALLRDLYRWTRTSR